MPDASASQVTMEKLLPLREVAAGPVHAEVEDYG